MLLVLTPLVVLLSACSGMGSSSPATVSTPAVQRFVAIKEASDNTSRLIELIATANQTSSQLAATRTGTKTESQLLEGAKIGWNNVVLGANLFSPSQAAAVPGLAAMITAVRNTAIHWSNGLNTLNHGAPHPASPAIARLQKDAGAMKKPIEAAVASIARQACTIEKANPGFVTPAAVRSDCANADQLAAS
jgi:dihydrodipicolinate synthase/N-acetylneuraminate lyase